MSVFVTGSIAFDHIMTYPGYFSDALVGEAPGLMNVSFVVTSLQRHYGGSGGAIAYNLALLGEQPRLVGAVGHDFSEYRNHLSAKGVDTSGVIEVDGVLTAACFITTDNRGNQIMSFFSGAMAHAGRIGLEDFGPDPKLVVISPNQVEAMVRLVRECNEAGVPFVYEPGQQVLALGANDLLSGIRGADCVCLNDYELAVVAGKASMRPDEVISAARLVLVTHGDQGSTAYSRTNTLTFPSVPARRLCDPTGAGEAYLAGVVQGLLRGDPPERFLRVATLAGSYAVEGFGTQGHVYSRDEFEARYAAVYGS